MPAPDQPTAPPPAARPPLGAVFWAFLLVGATSFGGGATAHIRDAVVRRRGWLDDERFLEALTVGRSLPGPNVSNLAAFVGAMLAGYRGAAAAVLGIVAPGVVAVLLLAASYGPLAAAAGASLRGGLRGLTAGAVGVMTSLVLNALKPVARARAGLVFAAGAFVAVAVLRLSVLVALVALVPFASALSREKGA